MHSDIQTTLRLPFLLQVSLVLNALTVNDNRTFDTGDFPYGAVLNSQTMEHAKPVDIGNIQRIMTIENKANYENMS